MWVLIDGREKSFRVEGEKEILFYLDYPEGMSMDEAQEQLEKENDGMNFYHIIEEKEGKEMNSENVMIKDYGSNVQVFLLEEEENYNFYSDNFVGFSYGENVDGMKECLQEKGIDPFYVSVILEKCDAWIARNSASIVTNSFGCEIDYKVAECNMDDEIREELHNELAPCDDQLFFDEYAKKHFEKYNEVWELAKENPCY